MVGIKAGRYVNGTNSCAEQSTPNRLLAHITVSPTHSKPSTPKVIFGMVMPNVVVAQAQHHGVICRYARYRCFLSDLQS